MHTVTTKIYDGYGEMHRGSVGDDLCKPDYPCLGPDPDRVEEGNGYTLHIHSHVHTHFSRQIPIHAHILYVRITHTHPLIRTLAWTQ